MYTTHSSEPQPRRAVLLRNSKLHIAIPRRPFHECYEFLTSANRASIGPSLPPRAFAMANHIAGLESVDSGASLKRQSFARISTTTSGHVPSGSSRPLEPPRTQHLWFQVLRSSISQAAVIVSLLFPLLLVSCIVPRFYSIRPLTISS